MLSPYRLTRPQVLPGNAFSKALRQHKVGDGASELVLQGQKLQRGNRCNFCPCIEPEPGVAFGRRLMEDSTIGLPNAAPLRLIRTF